MPIFENETQYQSWCNSILSGLGWYYWHRESGRTHKSNSHNYCMINGVKLRHLDLMIFKPNVTKPIFIELKQPKKDPNQEQQNTIDWLTKNNYPVYVCRTADDFMTAIGH